MFKFWLKKGALNIHKSHWFSQQKKKRFRKLDFFKWNKLHFNERVKPVLLLIFLFLNRNITMALIKAFLLYIYIWVQQEFYAD